MTSYLKESQQFFTAIDKLKGKKVLVLGHRRPDGDCIGSQVAMTRVLIQLVVHAKAVNEDPVPRTLKKFIVDTPFYNPDQIEEDVYIIVTVDCADHKRVGDRLQQRFPTVTVNIDHHVSNNNFENLICFIRGICNGNWLNFWVITLISILLLPMPYVGIATDTGHFVMQVPMLQF